MSNTEYTARSQAMAQVHSIAEMVAALECDYDLLEELRDLKGLSHDDTALSLDELEELAELEEAAGGCESVDEARERITEDPLSVEVRSAWGDVGGTLTPSEFRIVLCTGGPHVEIVGELDENLQPTRVRVLYRGWGESGELFDFDRDTVLTYCQQFYFGE